jgi:hypothetical protein
VEGGTWESIIFLELYCDELLLFDNLMNKNITFSFKKKIIIIIKIKIIRCINEAVWRCISGGDGTCAAH